MRIRARRVTGGNRLVEVADISLGEGTGTLLRVPCRSFRFRDK
jgi:hypothetical protein